MTEVKSPCVNVCSLGDQGLCIGCYRSAEEISLWYRMAPGEKREVLSRIDARALEFGAALSAFPGEDSSV